MSDDWGNDPVSGKVAAQPAAGADDWGDPVAGKVASKFKTFMQGQEPDSRLTRFGTGAMDVLEGGAQLLEHSLPKPAASAINSVNDWLAAKTGIVAPMPAGGMDEHAKLREQRIQESRGGATGVDPYRVAGGVAATLPMAALGAVGGGAVAGALDPVTGGDFWTQKGEQVALGAVGGKVAQAGGNMLAKAIKPSFDGAVKMLADAGVRLTPGQMAGGVAHTVESKLTSLPITGDAIKMGERRSIEDFNRAAVNRALAPIGVKVPDSVAVGRDTIEAGQAALKDAYDTLLPKVTFKADPAFMTDVTKLHGLVQNLPGDTAKPFNAFLDQNIKGRLGPQGTMDGQTFKQLESELTQKIKAYSGSAVASERELGQAFKEMRELLRDGLERSNPTEAANLSKINSAYAAFSRIEDASVRRPTAGGVFTPGDLLGAIKTAGGRAGRKAFARGDAMLQDFAEAGQKVLPNQVPDSGTAGRGMLALGAVGAAQWLHRPDIIAGLVTGALPYTSPGMSLLRRYATSVPGPTRNMLSKVVSEGSKYLAPGAAMGADSLVGQ